MINWLQHIRTADGNYFGPKAANLGELIRMGVPVPNGFVFRDPSPWGYYDLARSYQQLGGGRVAVRSSAIAEDLDDASFAGHYNTYLNVEGDDDVIVAVKKCFGSIDNQVAVDYRNAHGITNRDMAVLIQKMIPAEYAGVMFTKNPVTNNSNQIMIESVRGLGEKLVAGKVNPENYLLDKDTGENISIPSDGMLHPSHLSQLIDYGVQIEQHYECPQDIEWGIANGVVWIMQTRPITT